MDLQGISVETDGYKLTEVIGGKEIPWQLINKTCDPKGKPIAADLVFLGDLPSAGERVYRWEPEKPAARDDLPLDIGETSLKAGNGNIHAEIVNSRADFKEDDAVPAPLISAGRADRQIGRNGFCCGKLRPKSIWTTVMEKGPVITILKTEYFMVPI